MEAEEQDQEMPGDVQRALHIRQYYVVLGRHGTDVAERFRKHTGFELLEPGDSVLVRHSTWFVVHIDTIERNEVDGQTEFSGPYVCLPETGSRLCGNPRQITRHTFLPQDLHSVLGKENDWKKFERGDETRPLVEGRQRPCATNILIPVLLRSLAYLKGWAPPIVGDPVVDVRRFLSE